MFVRVAQVLEEPQGALLWFARVRLEGLTLENQGANFEICDPSEFMSSTLNDPSALGRGPVPTGGALDVRALLADRKLGAMNRAFAAHLLTGDNINQLIERRQQIADELTEDVSPIEKVWLFFKLNVEPQLCAAGIKLTHDLVRGAYQVPVDEPLKFGHAALGGAQLT